MTSNSESAIEYENTTMIPAEMMKATSVVRLDVVESNMMAVLPAQEEYVVEPGEEIVMIARWLLQNFCFMFFILNEPT